MPVRVESAIRAAMMVFMTVLPWLLSRRYRAAHGETVRSAGFRAHLRKSPRFAGIFPARKGPRPSELLEQAPETAHLIADAVLAQRVPIGGRVDGDHRLAEPQLRGRRQSHHR